MAWDRGQLRINFTCIFKVFTKLPESRSDEGNLENFENTSEINRMLLKRGMGNGEWEMDNGEWGMGN